MRSAARTLRSLVVLAAAVALASLSGLGGAAPVAAQSSRSGMTDRGRFVGTYRLVTTEVRDATGKWSQTPNFHSYGYITYSDSGHMGVYIVPRGRPLFASAQPTPDEAQSALRGFTAYFGTFSVNDSATMVVHHRVGKINPGGDIDFKRFYEFEGDRLTLYPAPADGGKDKATNRLVWERMPNPPLSAEAKKFVGAYKLLYTDTYREKDGKEVFHGDKNYSRAGTSYIIYTPTGHMMAHLMNKEGRVPYAGAQPTPDEALKAYQTYGGYFGRFTTYENYKPVFVMHHQQGTPRPDAEVDATKRFYQFTGNTLRLAPPPAPNQAGEMTQTHLYWERLGPGGGEGTR
jgi:hypothetical protein